MKTYSRINNEGEIYLTPVQKEYLKKHVGKQVVITLDERTNLEMIGFFEGAVVPYFFYQSGIAFKDFSDSRECLKLEFYPIKVTNLRGDIVKIAGSMAKLYESKERMKLFLDKIQHYFADQEFEFPNSEDYKKWRDNAPGPEEIYPPLQSLIDNHRKILENNIAPWRRQKR